MSAHLEMPATDLKQTAYSAATWTAIDTFSRQGIQFVISVVLARLLAPEDFGLIAMLAVFIALADAFVDSGLSAALIQRREVSPQDESTMFYANIVIAVMAYGVLWVAAPFVARFYDLPALVTILRVLALMVVIRSFGIIQTTLLRRRLHFRTLFLRNLLALPVSGAVGIVMACQGFGVWSLVAQQLVGAVLNVVCFWIMGSWRPQLVFSVRSFQALTGFGSRQLAVGLIDTLFQNIYQVTIGKIFSPLALGYYSRAVNLEKLATQNLTQIISRVAFPLFCTVHQDRERLRHVASRSLTMLAMVVFPIMVGLMVVARPLVEVLLSAKWLPCVPYFQLLCVAGILYPLHVINVNLLRAQGEMNAFLKLEVLKKALTVCAILITWRWGIVAMIWGQVTQSIVAYFLNAYFGGRHIGYSWRPQLRDALPYLGATLVMGTTALLSGRIIPPSPLGRLLVQVTTGACVYVAICHFSGLQDFKDVCAWGTRALASLKTRARLAGARVNGR